MVRKVIIVDCAECGNPLPVWDQEITKLTVIRCSVCTEADIAILKRALAEASKERTDEAQAKQAS